MKKNILIVWVMTIVVMSIIWYVSAQENIPVEEVKAYEENVMESVDPNVMEDMYKIAIHYCNDEIQGNKTNSYLTIQMRPGESKRLCITVLNGSTNHQDLTLWFTESVINEIGKQLCQGDLADRKNDFHKYIDLKKEDLSLSASGWYYTQIATIRLPKSVSTGDMYGCLGFFLSGAYFKGPNDVLWVRLTRNFPMKIVVTWDVYTLWRWDDVKYAYTDNKQNVLKIIVGVLAIRLIATIVSVAKKSTKKQQKKSTKK